MTPLAPGRQRTGVPLGGALNGEVSERVSSRQVYLGSVLAGIAWVVAFGLIIPAAVFDVEQLAWLGISSLAIAVTVTMRGCLDRHERRVQRMLALHYEVDQHAPDLKRVR
jgi:hypothetical protein